MSKSKSEFERKLGRISKKKWRDIQSKWLALIPNIESPGTPPTEALSENPTLVSKLKEVSRTGELRIIQPGLASLVLHEGLFFAHKSIRVTTTANELAEKGLLTWAISNAYQSSFFAIKAMLCLLGITCVTSEERNYFVDVLPCAAHKGQRQKRGSQDILADQLQIIMLPSRLEHRQWWQIFQRILNTSKVDFWDPSLHRLSNVAPNMFPRHRNRLHYYTDWFFQDLHEDKIQKLLEHQFTPDEIIDNYAGPDNQHLPLFVNLYLNRNLLLMISDLSAYSAIIKSEFELMSNTIQSFTSNLAEEWLHDLTITASH